MDEETKKRLDAQDELLLKIYSSVEKTRIYFKWTLIISVACIVLPLLGMVFIVPTIIGNYMSAFQGLL